MNATVVLIAQHTVARWASLALQASGLSVLLLDDARSFFSMEGPPGPFCVVVDANLPDITCHQLQAEVSRRGMPLLLLVNPEQIALAAAMNEVGVVHVLLKPVDADKLCRRVHGVLKTGPARERMGRLTQPEFEVMRLAASGVSNKDIAKYLSISFRTVEVHRRNAMGKTGTGFVRAEVLTDREHEILQLEREGIAMRLGISARRSRKNPELLH